ncbi:MAG: hypothetical protein DRO15_02005 [Thermoprotei archaeon]|nr:MAG: hypothetical protein DRO15_02005 [Thermoprotei archaeon]
MPSITELFLRKEIIECLRSRELSYDELRECLESKGIYIEGLQLRSIIASMIRSGEIKKIIDPIKRKFVLRY